MPEEKPIIPTLGQLSQPDPHRLFSKGIAQYNPSDIVGFKGLRVFDVMRKDEQVKSSIAFKKFSVVAAGYDIVSPEGVPDDWEPTEFCKWSFDSLPGSITDRIMAMLTSIEYGYAASEILWGEPLKGGPFARKWPVEDIVSIKPHSFQFEQDQQGKVKEIIQNASGEDIHIPIEKVVLMTYQGEWSNPYGRSDLDAAYRAYWSKDATHKWLAMLLERFGIPPIFAKFNQNQYPEGPVLDALRKVLTNLQAGTVATLPIRDPKDLELWSPTIAAHVQDVFIPALDRYDTEIARAILMPNLLGTTPEQQQGSYARAAVVFDVFLMAVDALRAQVEECINDQIIWRMIAVNYPTDADQYPRFRFKPLTQDSRVSLMETWVKLVAGRSVLAREEDEVHIREIMSFPSAESEPIARPEPVVPPGEEDDGEEDDGEEDKDTKMSQMERVRSFIESGQGFVSATKQIDFKAIEKRLDGTESVFIQEAKDDLENVLEILQRSIKAGQQPTSIDSIRGMSPFQASLRLMMMKAFEDGWKDLVSEVGNSTKKLSHISPLHLQSLPRVKPRDAIAFLKRKAITLSATVEDEILRDVRRILIAGVETGMSTIEVVEALGVVFEKWVGSDLLRDGQVIKPYRLEAIVRTETTGAYVNGRILAARDPELKGLIRGLRYDAILDSRTSDACLALSNRVFKLDSPELDALAPPNHVACRSILTPLTISQTVDEADFITPSEVGRAKELAGSGFAGGGSFGK